MLRGFGIAGLVLAAGLTAAAAQDMKSPRISPTRVDWDAVVADLRVGDPPSPTAAPELMAKLNRATGERFANIAASPVPVLLPFDTTAFLHARLTAAIPSAAGKSRPAAAETQAPALEPQPGTGPAEPEPNYLFGFAAVPFFYPGPAGYDAVVIARAQDLPELKIGSSKPIAIHISGSALLYELPEPTGMIEWPVHELGEIPGIRRIYLENYVRYTFVRYGVPYVVAIACSDGGAHLRNISCRDADKIAVRLLKALHVVGGTPENPPDAITPSTIDRPVAQSTVFTYHSPGDILAGTGSRHQGGVADYTVYSKIRFPLADAPAFANSQSFMNWGNCDLTGRSGAGLLDGVRAYRCRVNGQILINDESAGENYSYPWRDNFCEMRAFYVGQCPAGRGHQGQDIRPAFCKQRVPGANRCEPYQHDVVAIRDGAVLRAPNQEALYIVVNAPSERVRFRYLHMLPRQFDADGMVSGRYVREGEVLGKVGNFFRHERATTYHLHFDMQVPTKYGWMFVNPYMTLVASYERLIRGRGREIKQEETPENLPAASAPIAPAITPTPDGAAVTAAKPTETVVKSPQETVDSGLRRHERTIKISPVKASLSVDPGRRRGRSERGGAGAAQFRSLGRLLSRTSAGAGSFRRHLQPGHGQHPARHVGL
jgi:murein DD-endopeptidase MepM/ murein hydrolase activator NlpD